MDAIGSRRQAIYDAVARGETLAPRPALCTRAKPIDREPAVTAPQQTSADDTHYPRKRFATTKPRLGDKYERYQTLSGAAGTGAVFAEIGKFSGQPDAIDLLAVGGDAQVQLQNRLGLDGSTFRLVQNQMYQSVISRERVVAFNVSDAAPATVIAIGKWALYQPQAEGYQHIDEADGQMTETGMGCPCPDPPLYPEQM